MNGSTLSTCIEHLAHEFHPNGDCIKKVTNPFDDDIAEAEEGGREEGCEKADCWQLCKSGTQVASSHILIFSRDLLNMATCVVTSDGLLLCKSGAQVVVSHPQKITFCCSLVKPTTYKLYGLAFKSFLSLGFQKITPSPLLFFQYWLPGVYIPGQRPSGRSHV